MRKALLNLIFAAGGLILAAFSAHAQNYSIDWYKVAGGGGTSSNGQYVVTGTIGQPDASGQMNGGQYLMTGGFWSLIAVQTPGGPLLTIQLLNPTTATISWPSSATGFVLQQNTDSRLTNWVNFTGTTNDNGTNKSVTITPPAGNVFFRLKQ